VAETNAQAQRGAEPNMPGSDPIGSEGERILEITRKIIDEQDPYRLLNFIVQLNVLLEAKRERLKLKDQN
jgi:hypothetical protein